jgi:UDP-3-O-[3-hydroxymyristoyl] glucosamine N-acyltransferase
MKFNVPVPVRFVAGFIEAELRGDPTLEATGINEIHKVTPGDISFVDAEKYYGASLNSAATIIIINKAVDCPEGKALLVCADPFSAFVKLVKHFRPFEPADRMISDSAVVGMTTQVQPGVFIGNHVRIGEHCLIHSHVTIYDHCEIGDHVIIHSGTVIGADAFYYKRRPERIAQYDKLESCGRVLIHDHVEIGANCTVDKGVSGDTILGQGTKLDNMVHIGHGTVIGKNCLIVAQVGIAGKVHVEDEVILWGKVGVGKDLIIGKGAVVLGSASVIHSLEGGKTYMGYPAVEAHIKRREIVWIKRIPELWEKIKRLTDPQD